MTKRLTDSEKRMILSCFTYNSLNLGGQFLAPIVERVGRSVVEKEIKRLDDTYVIEYGTYTDHEGCTYNSLIEKNK